MKKLTLLVLFTALIGVTSNANAQNMSGDFAAGVGAGYGFDIEALGINAGFLYSFTDEIRAAVDFTYWMPDNEGVDETAWEINANAHYLFVNDMDLRVYALAGIHYAYYEFSFDFFGVSMEADDSEIGFNVGAGLEYDLGGIMLFAEPKFTVGGFEQLSVIAGVRFGF